MEGKVWNVSDEVKRLAKQATQEIFLANEDALLQMYDKEDIIAEYRDLLLLCQKMHTKTQWILLAVLWSMSSRLAGFSCFQTGETRSPVCRIS